MKYLSKIINHTVLIVLLLVNFSCASQSQIELLEYSSSECQEGIYFENFNRLQNRILSINKTTDFRLYNIFVVANCIGTQEGEVKLQNDTLKLSFRGKREYRTYKEIQNDSTEITIQEWTEPLADCDCAFNLSYKIKGLENKEYAITLNGQNIGLSEHKYVVIKNKPEFSIIDNDTLNLVDIYGLKQGWHVYNRKDGKPFSRINYIDDEKISGLAKTYYDMNGFDKIEIFMENRKFSISKYYKNDKLIKVCETDGVFDEGTNCKNVE